MRNGVNVLQSDLESGLAGFDECSVQYAKAMAEAGRLGGLINIHCEDQTCVSLQTQRLEAEGHSDIRHYADSRPRLSVEASAVTRWKLSNELSFRVSFSMSFSSVR